jgi:hypothetical protein
MAEEISEELKLAREALLEIFYYEVNFNKDLTLPKEIEEKIDAWMQVYKKDKYTIKDKIGQNQRS